MISLCISTRLANLKGQDGIAVLESIESYFHICQGLYEGNIQMLKIQL